jgi:hypothetical protein
MNARAARQRKRMPVTIERLGEAAVARIYAIVRPQRVGGGDQPFYEACPQ